MGWIIERLANNLDTVTGVFDILSGARRIFFSAILLMLIVSLSACSYKVRTTERIGASETEYSVSWGESSSELEPPAPRQHVSRRRAMREQQDQEVASSPLGAKWFK